MPINIQQETLIPYRDVPSWCEKNLGDRIHPSTAHRWRIRGARGVRLETVLAGGQRYTSHEALLRFCAETTAAADSVPEDRIEVVVNQSKVKSSSQFLDDEGI